MSDPFYSHSLSPLSNSVFLGLDTDSGGREYDFPELRESLSKLGVGGMKQLGEMTAEEVLSLISVSYLNKTHAYEYYISISIARVKQPMKIL